MGVLISLGVLDIERRKFECHSSLLIKSKNWSVGFRVPAKTLSRGITLGSLPALIDVKLMGYAAMQQ